MIVMSDESVENRGDSLSEVWWQGRQWAVTSHGIEARDGCYVIEGSRLNEVRGKTGAPDWPLHMAAKTWVDRDDFCTAFLVGLALHGHGKVFKPAVLMRTCQESIALYD
jgi:hypothetical protein